MQDQHLKRSRFRYNISQEIKRHGSKIQTFTRYVTPQKSADFDNLIYDVLVTYVSKFTDV
jgi:hypothetical protein